MVPRTEPYPRPVWTSVSPSSCLGPPGPSPLLCDSPGGFFQSTVGHLHCPPKTGEHPPTAQPSQGFPRRAAVEPAGRPSMHCAWAHPEMLCSPGVGPGHPCFSQSPQVVPKRRSEENPGSRAFGGPRGPAPPPRQSSASSICPRLPAGPGWPPVPCWECLSFFTRTLPAHPLSLGLACPALEACLTHLPGHLLRAACTCPSSSALTQPVSPRNVLFSSLDPLNPARWLPSI